MNPSHSLTVDEASRLAVTATVADLEYWANSVAIQGQVSLDDLTGFLNALRSASAPQDAEVHGTPALAAS